MKPSVFSNIITETMTDEIKCRESHKVDGHIPSPLDLHLDGRTCDCGRILFQKEPCGCIGNPHDELKSKENPNYGG